MPEDVVVVKDDSRDVLHRIQVRLSFTMHLTTVTDGSMCCSSRKSCAKSETCKCWMRYHIIRVHCHSEKSRHTIQPTLNILYIV